MLGPNTCSPGPLYSRAFLNPPCRSTHISQHLLSQNHPISDLCTGFVIISWCQTSPVNYLDSIWQTGLQGSSSLLEALGLSEIGWSIGTLPRGLPLPASLVRGCPSRFMTSEPAGTCLSSGPLPAGGLPCIQVPIPSMQTSDRTISGQCLS